MRRSRKEFEEFHAKRVDYNVRKSAWNEALRLDLPPLISAPFYC
jgi:hypothetical protein